MQIKNHEEILFESIYSSVRQNMSSMCQDADIDFIIGKISKNKSFIKSICLLPYWFYSCFENQNNIDIQNELFILGKANLQAWIAYTLYDYIRDGKIEKQKINLCVSIANIMHQKSIKDFYTLVDHNKDKINIINNLLNSIDSHYLENKTIEDIHYHFKHMCDESYKKSIGASIVAMIVVWLLGYKVDSNNHIETYEFFKNYLNARQLSDDEEDMTDDMLNNIYTPATFLMRAQYGSDYIHTMMRSRIDMSMRLAYEALRNIAFFDYEKFVELYVREC
jgi:hypothetical protein